MELHKFLSFIFVFSFFRFVQSSRKGIANSIDLEDSSTFKFAQNEDGHLLVEITAFGETFHLEMTEEERPIRTRKNWRTLASLTFREKHSWRERNWFSFWRIQKRYIDHIKLKQNFRITNNQCQKEFIIFFNKCLLGGYLKDMLGSIQKRRPRFLPFLRPLPICICIDFCIDILPSITQLVQFPYTPPPIK